MNASFLTRGAKGLNRRGFSVDDVLRMVECGIVGRDEQFELIEGEITLRMAPESLPHIKLKMKLGRWFLRALGDSAFIAIDSTLYLGDKTFLEPDIWITSEPMDDTGPYGGPSPTTLGMVVEIAVSSLQHDLYVKVPVYARHGVREAWVIDAQTLNVHVFQDPVEGVWSRSLIVGPNEALRPIYLPQCEALALSTLA
jgi:Uma2 family endonuclease